MALRFLVGPAGSGKTHIVLDEIIKASLEDSERSLNGIKRGCRSYLVIVPEQFSLQMQTDIMAMHPEHGSMNIDVISFERLAWMILEECSPKMPVLLDDLEQKLLLRAVTAKEEDRLKGLKRNLKKPGFLNELSALISEFGMYGIGAKELEKLCNEFSDSPLLASKLSDIAVIFAAFKDELSELTIPKSEMLKFFIRYIADSKILKDSVILLDSYTGFTPNQCAVIGEFLKTASEVCVTLTLGSGLRLENLRSETDMFAPTKKTYDKLILVAKEAGVKAEPPEYLDTKPLPRFKSAPSIALLESGFGRFYKRPKEVTPAFDDVFCLKTASIRDEADFIAAEICSLVRDEGYRYRDIAVVTTDIASYAPWLEKSFKICEIPVFIDIPRLLDKSSFADYVLSLSEPVIKGFNHESVFRLLKSEFAKILEDDVCSLENFVLATGIRGINAWKREWILEDDPEIDEKKSRAAAPLIKFAQELSGKGKTVSQLLAAYRDYMDEAHVAETLADRAALLEQEGDLSLAMEYQRAYELTTDLFDRIEAVLGTSVLSLDEFTDVLREGFSAIRAGVTPQSMDSVLAGDLSRSRVGNIKVMFLAGMNDGLLPSGNACGGILSDLEREHLKAFGVELAPTPKENTVLQKLRTYQNLTKPIKKLFLTYAAADENGAERYPSAYFTEALNIMGKVEPDDADVFLSHKNQILTETSAKYALAENFGLEENENWCDLYAGFLRMGEKKKKLLDLMRRSYTFRYTGDRIAPYTAKALFSGKLSGSATSLENYASCAYKWFLAHALGLKARKEHALDSRDVGTLLHAVLEEYFDRMKKEGFGFTQSEAERKRTVSDCVDYVIDREGISVFNDDERSTWRQIRLTEICDRTVEALNEHGKRGDFIPEGSELNFSALNTDAMNIPLGDSDEVMCLRGKIDRVDVCDNEKDCMVKIIDYKSGKRELDLTLASYGIQIQLFLYLDAAIEIERKIRPKKRVIPAGLFYFHIDDAWADMTDAIRDGKISAKDAVLKGYKMSGYSNSSADILSRIDRDLIPENDNISSPVIPVEYKNGEITKGSKVLDAEKFSAMSFRIRQTIASMGKHILEGEVSLNPYEYGSRKPCDYCEFAPVCAYEKNSPGFAYHALNKVKPEDI